MDKLSAKELAMNIIKKRGSVIMCIWSALVMVTNFIVLPVLGWLRLSYAVDALIRNMPMSNTVYLGALALFVGSKAHKRHIANGNGK